MTPGEWAAALGAGAAAFIGGLWARAKRPAEETRPTIVPSPPSAPTIENRLAVAEREIGDLKAERDARRAATEAEQEALARRMLTKAMRSLAQDLRTPKEKPDADDKPRTSDP